VNYTVGSLFAGIGGFDLGFERAGFTTSWQVEIDPYCQKVLAKNFPHAERFGDIRECGSHNLKPVDVICGGFPCQDISNAGKRAGIEGERSGLWSEMHRIIRELRPAYVLVENVAALLGRGMGVVLGDLAEIGFDAEWEIISAADVGAHHLRERVWILAYRERVRELQPQGSITNEQRWLTGSSEEMADTSSVGREGSRQPINASYSPESGEGQASDAFHVRVRDFWAVEPNVGRVAHGVPKRVDRLRGLGNAVVPQIPEMLARRIADALRSQLPEVR
jgi:DNA (cytosine-5)-methyltransferase 1